MDLMVLYAMQFVGVPYKWGGESPMDGFDCSGLVQAILRSAGADPPGDQTAQTLYDYFENKSSHGTTQAGSLVFYGSSVTNIRHVAFAIDSYRVIEAAGGGRSTLTVHDAVRDKAYVRISPIDYRNDLVVILKPQYTRLRLI